MISWKVKAVSISIPKDFSSPTIVVFQYLPNINNLYDSAFNLKDLLRLVYYSSTLYYSYFKYIRNRVSRYLCKVDIVCLSKYVTCTKNLCLSRFRFPQQNVINGKMVFSEISYKILNQQFLLIIKFSQKRISLSI